MKPINDPFFIFYDSRSGSTLLARLMTDYLEVMIPPEARFLPEALARPLGWWPPRRRRRFIHILKKDEKFSDWNVDIEALERTLGRRQAVTRRAMIEETLRRSAGKSTDGMVLGQFGFKKGEYQYKDAEILRVFPNALFICLIRDGRGVFNSKRKTVKSQGSRRPPEPEVNARKWMRCLDNFERLRRARPERVLVLHYEKVVLNTRAALTAISAKLGIPLRATASETYEVPERYATMHDNVKKAPIAGRIESWKTELTMEEIRRYEAVAGNCLIRYGYALMFPPATDETTAAAHEP